MVTRRRSIAREWSTQEEIRLFSLLCDFKPVGKKKHENMVKILESLNSDESNPFLEDQVWQKLDKFYDLERLGEIEDEADEEPEEELDNSVKKDGLQEGKISDSVEEKEEQEEGERDNDEENEEDEAKKGDVNEEDEEENSSKHDDDEEEDDEDDDHKNGEETDTVERPIDRRSRSRATTPSKQGAFDKHSKKSGKPSETDPAKDRKKTPRSESVPRGSKEEEQEQEQEQEQDKGEEEGNIKTEQGPLEAPRTRRRLAMAVIPKKRTRSVVKSTDEVEAEKEKLSKKAKTATPPPSTPSSGPAKRRTRSEVHEGEKRTTRSTRTPQKNSSPAPVRRSTRKK